MSDDIVTRLRSPWHHGDCRRAADEIDRLRAEVERLRVDAERYRWLREHGNAQWMACSDMCGIYLRERERLDAAIDAAIRASRAAGDQCAG